MAQISHARRPGAKCGEGSNTSTPAPAIHTTPNTAATTDRPFIVAGMRRYLNSKEASIYLDCTTRTLFRMVQIGRLRAFHLGRSLKFRPEDLEKAMEQKSSAPAAADELDDFLNQQTNPQQGTP
jgi:excisionase family DNA binding protein